MSEYQYYEFQLIDGHLSAAVQQHMQELSSRVNLSGSSASFVYNYGDFRGNPRDVLLKYFDVMLYIANWGSRQLMFKFPKNAVSITELQQYDYAENITISTVRDFVVVNIEQHMEEGYGGWIEGEGMLTPMIPLWAELLRGDHRALYIAWLGMIGLEIEWLEDDEDITEPPVPPNLGQLSRAHKQLINFFEVDTDLVMAAAQGSPKVEREDANLTSQLRQLSESEKDAYLVRLLKGEKRLDIELEKHLKSLIPTQTGSTPITLRRTLRELVERSKAVESERIKEEQRQAQIAHIKHMAEVEKRETHLWNQLPRLIDKKSGSSYDEAVSIMKDLQALAKHKNRYEAFKPKILEIREQYPTYRGLHDRMRRAGLI